MISLVRDVIYQDNKDVALQLYRALARSKSIGASVDDIALNKLRDYVSKELPLWLVEGPLGKEGHYCFDYESIKIINSWDCEILDIMESLHKESGTLLEYTRTTDGEAVEYRFGDVEEAFNGDGKFSLKFRETYMDLTAWNFMRSHSYMTDGLITYDNVEKKLLATDEIILSGKFSKECVIALRCIERLMGKPGYFEQFVDKEGDIILERGYVL